MPRIIAFDYGRKRVGIAVTAPQQIIATGLTTVPSGEVFNFLAEYLKNEVVECFVVGLPKQMNNSPSEAEKDIQPFVNRLKKLYPQIKLVRVDERFTSKMAFQTMIDGGLKRKARQNKALIDEISATIILQSYMSSKLY